ncbi:MAG: hypothetical protein R3213_11660 [Flavobacteriaceae bacterium]|nr:hypothetical protein [Flavobacteriaceae bacterium]
MSYEIWDTADISKTFEGDDVFGKYVGSTMIMLNPDHILNAPDLSGKKAILKKELVEDEVVIIGSQNNPSGWVGIFIPKQEIKKGYWIEWE